MKDNHEFIQQLFAGMVHDNDEHQGPVDPADYPNNLKESFASAKFSRDPGYLSEEIAGISDKRYREIDGIIGNAVKEMSESNNQKYQNSMSIMFEEGILPHLNNDHEITMAMYLFGRAVGINSMLNALVECYGFPKSEIPKLFKMM